MHDDIEKVLFTHEQIHQRIREVAAEISRDYAGRELMLVTVLKGAGVLPGAPGRGAGGPGAA